MSDTQSILPPNHTAVEAALEQAILKGKPNLAPIAQLMDPSTCPADLLGWLAWAFSVDVWDANWTEKTKRDVIRNSIAIHRIKGTVGSVRRALGTIGIRTDISEWFEYGGVPHTFRIDAFADDIFASDFQIDPKLFETVSRIIENVKPVYTHFTLRIGEKHGATVDLNTGSGNKTRECRTVSPMVPTDAHTTSLIACTGHKQSAISHHTHVFEMGDAA